MPRRLTSRPIRARSCISRSARSPTTSPSSRARNGSPTATSGRSCRSAMMRCGNMPGRTAKRRSDFPFFCLPREYLFQIPRSRKSFTASLCVPCNRLTLCIQSTCGGETRAPRTGMYTLYSMQRSGNSYKVRLVLARLGIPHRLHEVDILQGESRTPEFLAMNPSGQVPLLEVAPDRYLAESNAILWYLADGTPLLPEPTIERAMALKLMFFEKYR